MTAPHFDIGPVTILMHNDASMGYAYKSMVGNVADIYFAVPVCPAAVAHEAVHAAVDMLRHYTWQQLVRPQNCRAKKEEAMCLIVQHITYKVLTYATESGWPIQHRAPKGNVL